MYVSAMPFARVNRFAVGALAACLTAVVPAVSHAAAPVMAPTPTHRISAVQGSGETSPLEGQTVVVRGVVTGLLQAAAGVDGFYLQDEAASADGDPATSDGVYVYAPGNATAGQLRPGERVTVTGTVKEFNGLTELDRVTLVAEGRGALPPPVQVELPGQGSWERLEGMRVQFPATLRVSGVERLGQYGEVMLAAGDRLVQPTHLVDPNDRDPAGIRFEGDSNRAAVDALQRQNRTRSILLDDASSKAWPSPTPYLRSTPSGATLRNGDTITGLTGVLSYRFNNYRLDPEGDVRFVEGNPRPAAPPSVGDATLRVASANVLNYFVSVGGGSRGASSEAERLRQRAKILASLRALDADIYALMEVERHPENKALADLVAGLNEAAGEDAYALVDSRAIAGTDQIQVAMVYRQTRVHAVGPARTDTSEAAAVFERPPLVQTFEERAGGGRLTVVVNHFKSKSPGGAAGADLDQKDGQAAYNDQRRRQAAQLLRYLEEPGATLGDPDVLIVGDLNAYREEDPIDRLRAGGYVDLLQRFQGDAAYSYTYGAQAGYLDHALATASLLPQVTGAAVWHINADEPPYLDYNLENKTRDQQALNAGTPYRASDHDPVVVGLRLGAE